MMSDTRDRHITPFWRGRAVACGWALVAVALLLPTGLLAQEQKRIENRIAVFSALDKVTARISKLEVPLNETVRFGSLKVTPRVCYTRPPTERPKTTSLVEVSEVQLNGEESQIFSGWMFAESPALNAVQHPVFDVWLTDCSGPPAATAGKRGPASADATPSQPPARVIRRRVRR